MTEAHAITPGLGTTRCVSGREGMTAAHAVAAVGRSNLSAVFVKEEGCAAATGVLAGSAAAS
eukprot:945535-Pelagomonas_calceolata.AAC.1